MSKPFRFFSAVLSIGLVLCSGSVYAQQTRAVLNVTTGASPKVSVVLDFQSRKQLSFENSVAGIDNLAARITNLKFLQSGSGPGVSYRQLVPGEYLTDRDFSQVTYDVDLSPLKQRTAAAHVSWIKDDLGILMLGDVLPK